MKNAPEHEAKWHPLTPATVAAMWKTNVCTFSGRTKTLKQRWRTTITAAAIRHSILFCRCTAKLGWWKTPISIWLFFLFFILWWANRHTHFILPDDGNFCRHTDSDDGNGTCMYGANHLPPNTYKLLIKFWFFVLHVYERCRICPWNDSIQMAANCWMHNAQIVVCLPFSFIVFRLYMRIADVNGAGSNILVGWFGIKRMDWSMPPNKRKWRVCTTTIELTAMCSLFLFFFYFFGARNVKMPFLRMECEE